MKQTKLGLLDIRNALKDERFRNLFPMLEKEMGEYVKNPGCSCNATLFHKILEHKEFLQQYFPTKEITLSQAELEKITENHWQVINCKTTELEARLRKLPKGRKQLAVARYADEITVIVNELDIVT